MILRRYVLREFFIASLYSGFAFVFIYHITHLFERIGKYIDRKIPIHKLLVFYLYFTPQVLSLILPLIFMLGLFFSLGKLSRNNEILAVRSLGISPAVLVKPIVFIGVITIFLFACFNQFLVPPSNFKMRKWEQENLYGVKRGKKRYFHHLEVLDEKGRMITVGFYDAKKRVMRDVEVTRYKEGRITENLYAKRGVYKGNLWKLTEVWRRKFHKEQEKLEHLDSLYLDLPPPLYFEREKRKPDEMAFFELYSHIKRVESTGGVATGEKIELYMRFSYAFIPLILIFYGAPLAVSVKKRGFGFGFGWTLFISFIYWGTLETFRAMGVKGSLPPALSAWIPNIMFFLVGLFINLWRRI